MASAPITGWGSLNQAFPQGCFPQSAIHDFFCHKPEEKVAAAAFLSGLCAQLNRKGPLLWISAKPFVYPPGLAPFGWPGTDVVHLHLANDKQRLAAFDEALRCSAVHSVIADISHTSFKESRRLQLAVEQSGVTGFLLRHANENQASAALTKWRITHLPSVKDELPGVGHPRWQVQLLRVRNGKPGTWEITWKEDGFFIAHSDIKVLPKLHKKAV